MEKTDGGCCFSVNIEGWLAAWTVGEAALLCFYINSKLSAMMLSLNNDTAGVWCNELS